jgi:LuxR family maltose regulon positive regulatory protein
VKSHEIFLEELQRAVKEGSPQELFNYIEENILCFFATPFIAEYYQILKGTDMSASSRMLPKLIKAWLAFICGDNAGLFSIIKYIDESALLSQQESSLYYALKAISGLSSDRQEALKYAKLSIDILPEEDSTLFMANAKLTYAQILAGSDQYRSSIKLFEESYRIFYALDTHFPAVVAIVNKLLNQYKLGEFDSVMEECNRTLSMSASFRDEVKDYWNMLYLPLGMCCLELNKPSLALRYLKLAKECIDKLNMLHMHGMVEHYLFKSAYALNDKEAMERIKTQAMADFGHIHYAMTDLLLCMFRILSCEPGHMYQVQPDIERFEMEYMKSGEKSPFILLETLAYLKIKGLSDALTIEDMLKSLEKLRFVGMISYTQLFLIFLAEMHFMDNRPKNAAEALKEAITIYKEYGICVSFYMFPLNSIQLLQKIDPQLYNSILKKSPVSKPMQHGQILSGREKEIMQHIAMGKGNEEISKALFISVGTIKWHINHIFAKLEVNNRIQAVEKAKSLGEIS